MADAHSIQLQAAPEGDLAQSLNACIRALSPKGGICDGRNFGGKYEISTPVVINKPAVVVLLPVGEIRVAAAGYIAILADGVVVEGGGTAGTVLVSGKGAVLQLGDSKTPVRRWRVTHLGLRASTAQEQSAGLILENAREGNISDVQVVGFNGQGAAGIRVGVNCWAVTLDNVYLTSNTTGLMFGGGNLNGWSVRGGYINLNSVGISFDIGKGSAHGLVFGSSVIIENNRAAGLLFRSGRYYGITFSEFYGETPNQARFIDVTDASADLSIDMLTITRGYLQVQSDDAFRVVVSKTGSVRLSMENLVVEARQPIKRVAWFDGSAVGAMLREVEVLGMSEPGNQPFGVANRARVTATQ